MGCKCFPQIFAGGTFWEASGLDSPEAFPGVVICQQCVQEAHVSENDCQVWNWTVAYNQICLTLFQKLCTADGGTVCDFNADIRIGLMEFLQIINEKIPADRIAGSRLSWPFSRLSDRRDLPRPEAGEPVAYSFQNISRIVINEGYCSLRSQQHASRCTEFMLIA